MKFIQAMRGLTIGCDRIDIFTTVYYGYIREHRFNLYITDFDGHTDYTMYLDENMKEPYFLAEREEAAKQKISALLNGR